MPIVTNMRLFCSAFHALSFCSQHFCLALHSQVEIRCKRDHPKCDPVPTPSAAFETKFLSVAVRLSVSISVFVNSNHLREERHKKRKFATKWYENGCEKVDGKTRESRPFFVDAGKPDHQMAVFFRPPFNAFQGVKEPKRIRNGGISNAPSFTFLSLHRHFHESSLGQMAHHHSWIFPVWAKNVSMFLREDPQKQAV